VSDHVATGILQRFPLEVIRRMLDRSPEAAPDLRRLASEIFDPANLTGSIELKRADLADRLGTDAERHLAACGLVEVIDDDLVVITDTSTFDYVEKLTGIGLPLDRVAAVLARMAEHHIASVQALIELYREEIWQPFADAGLPSEQWHAIADKTTQLRPLAIGLGIQAFRRAIDEVVGKVAAGCGLTTVSPNLSSVLPDGVQVMRVEDAAPAERRRALVARRPGRPSSAVAAVIDALRSG
jgi:hypothetical protein